MEEEYQSQSSQTETYMLGFVIANIVGIQYYSGTISGREMVILVREPLNPYDENAIKVLNTKTGQVGHIERGVASVLSPLIDSNMIAVEGIVPKTRTSGNRFKIPCQIHIFASIQAVPTAKAMILAGGLHLISHSDASFTLSEAVAVKETKAESSQRNLDKIFKMVDENVSKKKAFQALEPPKEVIVSELFVHQKEGLGWLLHRENSNELPPFWEEKDGSFVNVLTNYHTDKRPEPLRGGIFADDMGLGKTLTLLSLIAYDKSGTELPSLTQEKFDEMMEQDEGLCAFVGKKRGVKSKLGNGSRKKGKIENKSVCRVDETFAGTVKRTTLVVCPPSVFSTWISQLEQHTKRGTLKIYLYYGDRTNDVEELQNYDLVLTTYSTLAVEEFWDDTPVKKIEWWRVILDEAHIIKNVNAKQSMAVTNLKAKRRWVVTGTPIQNGSFDLFSLMAFLRFEPFSVKSYWQSLVQRPITLGNEQGLSRLQVLMATISLRRTKDREIIGLPPKTMETHYIDLSTREREIYDQLEGEAKSIVQRHMESTGLMRNYSTILSIILRLRQICIDIALCPSDLKSILPSSNIEDLSNNPELLKKLVELLRDGEEFDCPICISPPTNMVITRCSHIFCEACILKTLKHKSFCPICRGPLSQSDLFSAPPESSEADNIEPSSSQTRSSKVSALLQLITASRDENPAIKSVVFSQFRKMLILLEEPLKAAGFKVLRIDGSMNAKRRAQVIDEFGVSGPNGPMVMLASLKSSAAGINLTAASRVYLLEPWWNPAVEEQAMDRVHRIGQKNEVKIVRLIAKGSIEERILDLQEKKKKLAREAFGKRTAKDQREIKAADLRLLLSL